MKISHLCLEYKNVTKEREREKTPSDASLLPSFNLSFPTSGKQSLHSRRAVGYGSSCFLLENTHRVQTECPSAGLQETRSLFKKRNKMVALLLTGWYCQGEKAGHDSWAGWGGDLQKPSSLSLPVRCWNAFWKAKSIVEHQCRWKRARRVNGPRILGAVVLAGDCRQEKLPVQTAIINRTALLCSCVECCTPQPKTDLSSNHHSTMNLIPTQASHWT